MRFINSLVIERSIYLHDFFVKSGPSNYWHARFYAPSLRAKNRILLMSQVCGLDTQEELSWAILLPYDMCN